MATKQKGKTYALGGGVKVQTKFFTPKRDYGLTQGVDVVVTTADHKRLRLRIDPSIEREDGEAGSYAHVRLDISVK